MGKGSGRRPAAISQAEFAANYDRIFGKKPSLSDDDTAAGEIMVDYDVHRGLQRDAQIARHLKNVLPLVYAQMERELRGAA